MFYWRPTYGAWRGSKMRGDRFVGLGGHTTYQEALEVTLQDS